MSDDSDEPRPRRPLSEGLFSKDLPSEDLPFGDHTLRTAWSSLAEEVGSVSESVDDEAIWEAAAGRGSKESRQGLVDRLVTDVVAAESWRIAVELQRELQAAEIEKASRGRRWRLSTSRQGWLVAAALVIATLGVALMTRVDQWGGRDTSEQVFRQGGGLSGDPEIQSALSESEPLPRDRAVLRWSLDSSLDSSLNPSSESSNEARYTLRVLGPNLDPLLTLRNLDEPEAHLPVRPLEKVADGEQLLWQVEALLPDGRTITSSTFFASLGPGSDSPASSE